MDIIVEVAVLQMDHTWFIEEVIIAYQDFIMVHDKEISDEAEEKVRQDLDSKNIPVAHVVTLSISVP